MIKFDTEAVARGKYIEKCVTIRRTVYVCDFVAATNLQNTHNSSVTPSPMRKRAACEAKDRAAWASELILEWG